jgi:hypothetical protein
MAACEATFKDHILSSVLAATMISTLCLAMGVEPL